MCTASGIFLEIQMQEPIRLRERLFRTGKIGIKIIIERARLPTQMHISRLHTTKFVLARINGSINRASTHSEPKSPLNETEKR